jgi:hypothetical protein
LDEIVVDIATSEAGSALARFVRDVAADCCQTRAIGRIDGGGLEDIGNAFGVVDRGSRGTCRVGHGPLVTMAPVMTASMAACG